MRSFAFAATFIAAIKQLHTRDGRCALYDGDMADPELSPRRMKADWQLRSRQFVIGERTLIMGVVNITQDSFSDGGLFLDPERAAEHALQLLDEGADLLDLGAESTRPGSHAGDA